VHQGELEVERQRVADAGRRQKAEMIIMQKEVALLTETITEKEDQAIDLRVRGGWWS
jgi:hypothetical protein